VHGIKFKDYQVTFCKRNLFGELLIATGSLMNLKNVFIC